MTTPKAITFMVVGGLGSMALTYMGTLAACVLLNIDPNEKMMRAFEGAGMFILGAFSSILVNTRSHQSESKPDQGSIEMNLTTTTKEKEIKDA